MKKLQKLGGALMQPVAILPVAALLMGIGYWIDPTGWGANSIFAAFLLKAGGAVLDNLGVLFAVGIAYGLSDDKNGAAALSGLVAFLTLTTVLSAAAIAQYRGIEVTALPGDQGWAAINNKNVLFGIISGMLGALSYNKFSQKKLPDALAFFSGRRLAPIMAAIFALIASGVLYFIWPFIYKALYHFGMTLAKMGPLGAGIYGFFNRLLIPTGLHHALNSIFWFDVVGINDIGRFLGDPAKALDNLPAGLKEAGHYVGMYQAGFFPIMMFGLPGAALAMYTCAKPEKKKVAAGLLLSAAFASFFTGVTEPLEFSFMFLAPVLYIIHALLTGIVVGVVAFLKYAAGFGFSAGFVDLFLSFKNPNAHQPWMLIVVGIIIFFVYFLIFRFAILKFNLKTPGREDDDVAVPAGAASGARSEDANIIKAAKIVEGLGGKENIRTIENCATRLRCEVIDGKLINESKIKEAGVAGVMRTGENTVQVIVGTSVQFIYDEIVRL